MSLSAASASAAGSRSGGDPAPVRNRAPRAGGSAARGGENGASRRRLRRGGGGAWMRVGRLPRALNWRWRFGPVPGAARCAFPDYHDNHASPAKATAASRKPTRISAAYTLVAFKMTNLLFVAIVVQLPNAPQHGSNPRWRLPTTYSSPPYFRLPGGHHLNICQAIWSVMACC